MFNPSAICNVLIKELITDEIVLSSSWAHVDLLWNIDTIRQHRLQSDNDLMFDGTEPEPIMTSC